VRWFLEIKLSRKGNFSIRRRRGGGGLTASSLELAFSLLCFYRSRVTGGFLERLNNAANTFAANYSRTPFTSVSRGGKREKEVEFVLKRLKYVVILKERNLDERNGRSKPSFSSTSLGRIHGMLESARTISLPLSHFLSLSLSLPLFLFLSSGKEGGRAAVHVYELISRGSLSGVFRDILACEDAFIERSHVNMSGEMGMKYERSARTSR